jgi:DNA-binding protein
MFLDVVKNTLTTRKIILRDTMNFYSVEQKDFLDYMMRSHKLSQMDSGRHEEIIVPKRTRKISRAVLSLVLILFYALPLNAQDTIHRLKEVSIVSSYQCYG